jgi:hypothetical protein
MSKCIITDIRGDYFTQGTGLSPKMTKLFNWMVEVAQKSQMQQPVILSACRSPERQQYYQALWDMGQREGLSARPVTNSKHIPDASGLCRAFDLANDREWLYIMGQAVVSFWPDIEWGGTYLPPDYPHFEERW